MTRGGTREGAGRPAAFDEETKMAAFKLPVSLLARLKKAAAERAPQTQAELVAEALRAYLPSE